MEKFDAHKLHVDSLRLGELTQMDESDVRKKAEEYKRDAERHDRGYEVLLPRHREEVERLLGHYVFELALKTREREQLERSLTDA